MPSSFFLCLQLFPSFCYFFFSLVTLSRERECSSGSMPFLLISVGGGGASLAHSKHKLCRLPSCWQVMARRCCYRTKSGWCPTAHYPQRVTTPPLVWFRLCSLTPDCSALSPFSLFQFFLCFSLLFRLSQFDIYFFIFKPKRIKPHESVFFLPSATRVHTSTLVRAITESINRFFFVFCFKS